MADVVGNVVGTSFIMAHRDQGPARQPLVYPALGDVIRTMDRGGGADARLKRDDS